MQTSEPEGLEHVLLSVDDAMCGGATTERVWAKPLGDDLYQIRNTPWHTCEVAWGDVVLAKADHPDVWPTMVKIVHPSGHKTLHIYFHKTTSEEVRDSVLKGFKQWKASYENADDKLYALDVEPGGDYNAVLQYLESMEAKGVLDFRNVVSKRT